MLYMYVLQGAQINAIMIYRYGIFVVAECSSFLLSWLLHDPNMELRTMYPPFVKAVERYFDKLMPILVPLQVGKCNLRLKLTV